MAHGLQEDAFLLSCPPGEVFTGVITHSLLGARDLEAPPAAWPMAGGLHTPAPGGS